MPCVLHPGGCYGGPHAVSDDLLRSVVYIGADKPPPPGHGPTHVPTPEELERVVAELVAAGAYAPNASTIHRDNWWSSDDPSG